MKRTDNTRITARQALIPPVVMVEELPLTEQISTLVRTTRQEISDILHGKDDRLLVLVGPCSVHELESVKEYATRLSAIKKKLGNELCLVMRTYFEKPRTTVGWKGFINDPDLDASFDINKGIRLARQLLLDISSMGMACGAEFLDLITPQFIGDLISWGAIGARTTESQIHRELASGLSAPIGFKNTTNGDVQTAIDSVKAAFAKHRFVSITKQGNLAIYTTSGNPDAHVVLRGGKSGPNYDENTINSVSNSLREQGLTSMIMVDCSHANSGKDYKQQPKVAHNIAEQVAKGSDNIMGVMLESYLEEGNQSISSTPLVYGKSVTDSCMSWEMTVPVLEELAKSVIQRRNRRNQ
ncbi:MAG: 3-deoxy-7-phosphoheptulonate synthase [Thiotrichales bacterium]|nr:MAG: 3-deoxy-7-phosphoheptulonate synthase [Thiotrichales bacterium]